MSRPVEWGWWRAAALVAVVLASFIGKGVTLDVHEHLVFYGAYHTNFYNQAPCPVQGIGAATAPHQRCTAPALHIPSAFSDATARAAHPSLLCAAHLVELRCLARGHEPTHARAASVV